MYENLCILLIFSKLNLTKVLIDPYRMQNLYAIFARFLDICKQVAGNLVNESGNVPRRGVVPRFSDIEIVTLNMTSEAVGIDSESLLFANIHKICEILHRQDKKQGRILVFCPLLRALCHKFTILEANL